MNIILASESPRRKYLLNMLLRNFGLTFDCVPSRINEGYQNNKNYGSLVIQLARKKALAVLEIQTGIIVAADTIVVLHGKILGKPASKEEAKRILKLLSGKKHKVYTGLVILNGGESFESYEVTDVSFRKLLDEEINFYVNSGSPMDKAGAYGIQDDFGSTFIRKIDGDYFNVVGLPLLKTYVGLNKFIKFKF
jgi:nucleoside triphosphate pyrophosphatase